MAEKEAETIETGDEGAARAPVSGLYQSFVRRPWGPPRFRGDELRLDVDGHYPQMVASGTVRVSLSARVSWIARVRATARSTWTGTIFYKDGPAAALPHTTVTIVQNQLAVPPTATATFTGLGTPRTIEYGFRSPFFHPVNFEFDSAEGEAPTVTINTGAHPNRPATLPIENLTVQEVYRRAGFEITTSPGGAVPIAGAGANARWSDQEMHDAMQTYWSRFQNAPQWALWVFTASLHEQGTSLGGVMFDDLGPNHRQGTAIFNDAFIANAPAGDPAPAAWVDRMRFWTTCHEMGHAFNLAHSWQKSLGTPWVPLVDEPEARSFMNYPYNVAGGQSTFFADFAFRFTDSELLFMRHAPARFVQQGNADWFDHHGFEEANVSPEAALALEARVNRDHAVYEFLEPITIELKLKNVSSQPQLMDARVLARTDAMTVVTKKDGRPARRFVPHAQYCWLPERQVLLPGQSLYDSLFVSAGLNGWDLAEPGDYTIRIALTIDGEDIVSNPLRLRVTPPGGQDEEVLAQDFFSEDVGRVLAFDGSQVLDGANATLWTVAERLDQRRVALHAQVALGSAVADEAKYLVADPADSRRWVRIERRKADVTTANKFLSTALITRSDAAVESLGHVDYRWYVERFNRWLAHIGSVDDAVRNQDSLLAILTKRKVLDTVLQQVQQGRDALKTPVK